MRNSTKITVIFIGLIALIGGAILGVYLWKRGSFDKSKLAAEHNDKSVNRAVGHLDKVIEVFKDVEKDVKKWFINKSTVDANPHMANLVSAFGGDINDLGTIDKVSDEMFYMACLMMDYEEYDGKFLNKKNKEKVKGKYDFFKDTFGKYKNMFIGMNKNKKAEFLKKFRPHLKGMSLIGIVTSIGFALQGNIIGMEPIDKTYADYFKELYEAVLEKFNEKIKSSKKFDKRLKKFAKDKTGIFEDLKEEVTR